jgi:hypothetical protein
MTLMIIGAITPVSGIHIHKETIITHTTSNNLDYPNDFEFYACGGGFCPWSDLNILLIESNGHGTFSKIYADDRDTGIITNIDEFDLTLEEMNQLWTAVNENDFFNLNTLYSEPTADGTFCYVMITANNDQHIVETRNFPLPQFDRIMEIVNMLTPGDYDIGYNGLLNLPPAKPSTPSGETEGRTGRVLTYTTQTTDPNEHPIYYWFEWGDDSNSGWVGPFDSGIPGSATHQWSAEGNYNITVRARDDPNGDGDISDGAISRLSDPLPITMPKGKSIAIFLNDFLEKITIRFPFFRNIIHYFDEIRSEFSASFNTFTQSGTTVEIDGCYITVTIHIQIWGPGASDDLANEIETDIEDVWNTDKDGNNWRVKCKEDCDPREPGCLVTFDADVKKVEPWEVLPGYHDIFVREDDSGEGYSTVDVTDSDDSDNVLDSPRPNDGDYTRGRWDNNEPAHTWAHEAGHLFGLDDKYTDTWNDANGDGVMQDSERTSTPDPGHENDIMANLNGKPLQSAIDAIVDMSGVECPCECCPEEEDNEAPANDIQEPQDNSEVSNPVTVHGYADDGPEGSGIVKLDYSLVWATGNYDGSEFIIDPPEEYVNYELGPLNLDPFIDPGDWIIITTYAIDAADNVGEDSVTVTWIEEEEDTIPPVTEETVGEPQWEGGYTIASFTPIWLNAIDPDPGSGVNHIHYEVWQAGIMRGSEDVPGNFVEMTFGMYGVLEGIAELHFYAVDNENNVETTHISEHFILY